MKYKTAVTLFSAAIFAGAFATPSLAWDRDYHPRADRSFESSRGLSGGDPDQGLGEFLNNGNNNDFARRYRENPNIIYDKDVMAHEPGFRAYLDAQSRGARTVVRRSWRPSRATMGAAQRTPRMVER